MLVLYLNVVDHLCRCLWIALCLTHAYYAASPGPISQVCIRAAGHHQHSRRPARCPGGHLCWLPAGRHRQLAAGAVLPNRCLPGARGGRVLDIRQQQTPGLELGSSSRSTAACTYAAARQHGGCSKCSRHPAKSLGVTSANSLGGDNRQLAAGAAFAKCSWPLASSGCVLNTRQQQC